MKQIVIVLNGKGGVGKSFLAVNLVQYLVDHQVTHTVVRVVGGLDYTAAANGVRRFCNKA